MARVAFAHLAFAAGFEKQGEVDPGRFLPAKCTDDMRVQRKSRQPFRSTNNMAYAHQVIINHGSQVIERQTIGFDDNVIVDILIFNRNIALAVGLPATIILYAVLFLTGTAVTVSLRSIGGLLIFSLILNPAAAAYQLTYSMKKMFLLSAVFGVLSGWVGLFFSYIFDLPSGATIVVTSALIFLLAVIFSPKRRVKRWQTKLTTGKPVL